MKKFITPLRVVILLLVILTVAIQTNKGLFDKFFKSVLADSFNLNVSDVDNWASGYTVAPGNTYLVDNTDATIEDGEPCDGLPCFNSVWYKFIPEETGTYVADTCNGATGKNTVMWLYRAGDPDSITNLQQLDSNDDGPEGFCPDQSLASRLEDVLQSGTTYYYQIANRDADNGGPTALNLNFINLPTISQGIPWTTSTSSTSFDAHVIGFYESGPIGNIQFQLNGGTWTNCTADDGTFDARNVDEPATCAIIGLAPGATNHIKFKTIGEDLVETLPDDYLSLDLDVGQSPINLTNQSDFLTTVGNFVFTGSVLSSDMIDDVKWRNYIEGQAVDVNWSDCTADDGTFDSANENFTCTIPTTSVDGEYHFEIKEDDESGVQSSHVYPTAMLIRSKK